MAPNAPRLTTAQVALYQRWIATFGFEHAGALPGMNGNTRRSLRVLVQLGFLVRVPGAPPRFYAVERAYRDSR